MKWIVENVPAWVVGVVLLVGLPGLAVLARHFIHERTNWMRSAAVGSVADTQIKIVAAVYAIIVGFTIVSLYQQTTTASSDLSSEAAQLLQLHQQGKGHLGPVLSARIDHDIVDYASAVAANWKSISEGDQLPKVTRDFNDLYATLDSYTPHTPAQSDYLDQLVSDMNSLSQARSQRSLDAKNSGSLPAVLWVAILITTLVTLGFSVICSVENRIVAYLIVFAISAILAVNIFVLIELSYPLVGPASSGPADFVNVIHIVQASP